MAETAAQRWDLHGIYLYCFHSFTRFWVWVTPWKRRSDEASDLLSELNIFSEQSVRFTDRKKKEPAE